MKTELSKKYKIEIAGKEVTFETGALCMQSNGSCLVSCGETVIMVNVTMSDEPKPGIDFFPLSVEYQEKMYSVGKIPGGFKKREGRPSDKAILVSRSTVHFVHFFQRDFSTMLLLWQPLSLLTQIFLQNLLQCLGHRSLSPFPTYLSKGQLALFWLGLLTENSSSIQIRKSVKKATFT